MSMTLFTRITIETWEILITPQYLSEMIHDLDRLIISQNHVLKITFVDPCNANIDYGSGSGPSTFCEHPSVLSPSVSLKSDNLSTLFLETRGGKMCKSVSYQ